MRVPFVDLSPAHKEVANELTAVFSEVLDTSQFVNGARTAQFEREFSDYCGAKFASLVGNGTLALQAALLGLELPAGGEVLVPVNTFIATAEAVINVGLRPVFVDCDPNTHLIDIDATVAAVTDQTVAVLPVHLYGRLVDMRQLRTALDSARKDVVIVEDSCQAHGAFVSAEKPAVSKYSSAACFSFYPGKNLGALGEAGAVVTNSAQLDTWIKKYRNHGSEQKYKHDIIGSNYRTSELQAGFLSVKLPHLNTYNQHRRQVAEQYHQLLADVSQVELPPLVTNSSHVYHLFVARVEKRKQLKEYLNQNGVGVGIHYPDPLHLTPAFEEYFSDNDQKKQSFPAAESTAQLILSLPIYYGMTNQQVEYVCQVIKSFYFG